MLSPNTNGILLSSIPLNRKMKRYWERKFERIVANCGLHEAISKFKNLRIQVLKYISDKDRKSNLDNYLTSTGFRRNGYLKMLFAYADTQPHFVLSFLKLYTQKHKPTQSVDTAAYQTKKRLEQVRANKAMPTYIRSWLKCVNTYPSRSYKEALMDESHPFHRLALNHSYKEWHGYWSKWYSVLRKGWKSSSSPDYKPVFPEIYKDYDEKENKSEAYNSDFASLIDMHNSMMSPLSESELDFVDGFLNEDVGDALRAVLWGESDLDPNWLKGIFQFSDMNSGTFVGHVHHIHKKGGGDELRDIAVPNRFIQNALVPAADRLYNLVRLLPKDATFDQDKFDTLIQNRVNNDNLYQGSVDLSKASDNLPFSWGDEIVLTLQSMFVVHNQEGWYVKAPRKGPYWFKLEPTAEKNEEEFVRSYSLFQTVARANWEDQGYFITWQVGQPLGSLPSFAMLAITHNLLLESLAAMLGLMHSPYFVLGDDVVITNKRLRKRYIRELTSRGIPLSLHKSYEGRLSEFAGKTYVKNAIPFYTSDHSPVTFESLFDWQRTTGIRIPWINLPRRVKNQLYEEVRRTCGEKSISKKVKQLTVASYDLVLTCEVTGRGSHIYPIRDSEEVNRLISGYFEYRDPEDHCPDAVKHTGITVLSNGHPVVLMSSRFADKDGYFQRYRPVQLPAWYKDKVRPCATTAAIKAATMAVLNVMS